MPLTLCTLSLICSMCSFLCATFDNHLLRQSPIVSKQPLHIHTYIYVCVCVISIIQKPKKKKISYNSMNIRIRIFSIGLFNDRSIQKKNDWEKKRNYYTSPPLSISSLRPHWRCSHIVGYFCPFTHVHAHHR